MGGANFDVTRGSDVELKMRVTVSGAALDLSPFDIGFIDVASPLVGRLSADKTNAANGQFSVLVEGTDPIPCGTLRFRIQISQDGVPMSSLGFPLMGLSVQ